MAPLHCRGRILPAVSLENHPLPAPLPIGTAVLPRQCMGQNHRTPTPPPDPADGGGEQLRPRLSPPLPQKVRGATCPWTSVVEPLIQLPKRPPAPQPGTTNRPSSVSGWARCPVGEGGGGPGPSAASHPYRVLGAAGLLLCRSTPPGRSSGPGGTATRPPRTANARICALGPIPEFRSTWPRAQRAADVLEQQQQVQRIGW